jgi:hypothetical protein
MTENAEIHPELAALVYFTITGGIPQLVIMIATFNEQIRG